MINVGKFLKPVLGMALVGMISGAASADCPTADSLGLSPQQRQQLWQLGQGGNMSNPNFQQQVMGVLTPAQQAQLQRYGQQANQQGYQGQGYQGQGRHHRHHDGSRQNNVGNNSSCSQNQGNVNYSPYQTPVVNQSYYPTQQGYYPTQQQGYYPAQQGYYPTQQQGYYPTQQGYYPTPQQGYYPAQQGYDNGLNLGLNVLTGLLNSGILNGAFNNGMR